jgi:hypothetical protein
MQHEKPLLRGLVSLRKDNAAETFKGEFELYEDHVVLRISDKFSLSSIARRSLPPTFPDVELKEFIPFSPITSLHHEMKKGVLSRYVTWKMKTDEGTTWSISGSSKLFESVQNTYQAWKRSNLR